MNRIRSPSGEPCERGGGVVMGKGGKEGGRVGRREGKKEGGLEGGRERREGWKEGMKGEKEVRRRESEMTEKGEVC